MLSKNTVEKISTLATRLIAAKKRSQPYCLYVGADVSRTSSGKAAFEYLREEVMRSPGGGNLTKDAWDAVPENRKETDFTDVWGGLGNLLQEPYIEKLMGELRPSAGHQALARILKAGLFRVIFTSNADNLLEKELGPLNVPTELAGNEDDINNVLNGLNVASEGVTILKLCGDFRVGRRYTITFQRIMERVKKLENVITRIPAGGLVMIGYSRLDECIFQSLENPELVRFAGKAKPPGEWRNFWTRFQENSILDDELNFDNFCGELAKHLGLSDDNLVEFVTTEAYEPPLIEVLDDESLDVEDVEIIKGEQTVIDEDMVDFIQHSVFTVKVDNDNRVSFNVSGRTTYDSDRSRKWDVSVTELNAVTRRLGDDIEAYAKLGDQAGIESWRERAKREGKLLYESLVDDHRDLGQQFFAAKGGLRSDEILTLNFRGGREHLGLPYELLHDGKSWLTTHHPICRQVSGVKPNHNDTLDGTIVSLLRENKALRALLVSADTGTPSISVDLEVKELEKLLKRKSGGALKVECDVLLTPDASLDEVEKRLNNCRYHVVHFAGHGDFDPGNPERSGLELFKNKKRKGGVGTLTAIKLGELLRGSQLRLFYLSCCVGAAGGDRHQLRKTDYLGVMDALVQAGVPYVLGYRWYVTDEGSRTFGQHFYENLLNSPHVPEYAAWEARRKIYGDNGADETWASPILVAQTVRR